MLQRTILNCPELSGLIVSEGLRKSSPNVTVFFLQNFSLSLIADIFLLVTFLFCPFFCFLNVYLLPVMVNKDVYNGIYCHVRG